MAAGGARPPPPPTIDFDTSRGAGEQGCCKKIGVQGVEFRVAGERFKVKST